MTRMPAHVIENIKRKHNAEVAKLDGQKSGSSNNSNGDNITTKDQKPVYVIKKYSTGMSLAEAVIVNGEPFFAQVINRQQRNPILSLQSLHMSI